MSLGFDQLEADHCAYFYGYDDGSFYILLLYVDDMLIASDSIEEVSKLKCLLQDEFEMKYLVPAKKIHGM